MLHHSAPSKEITRVFALIAMAFLFTIPAAAQEAPAVEEEAAAAAQQATQAAAEPVSNTAKIATVYRNGYSVTINGRSQDIGTFSIAFKISGEEPVIATVNVIKGMQKKKIAQDLKKELTIAAGGRYKVKQSGSKVTVKKANKKTPPLSLQITEQKLTGVSLLISGL